MDDCATDGGLGQRGDWGACSVTCGVGTESRQRQCDNPAPENGGADCTGEIEQTQACTKDACATDGGLGQWSDWGVCSVTCGDGTETRQRQCDSPAPENGGADCVGEMEQTQTCSM